MSQVCIAFFTNFFTTAIPKFLNSRQIQQNFQLKFQDSKVLSRNFDNPVDKGASRRDLGTKNERFEVHRDSTSLGSKDSQTLGKS